MKDWNEKQVLQEVGTSGRGRVNDEGKGEGASGSCL
jgi:hypothetical protein